MGDRVPGPMCSSKLGLDWIDKGTLCRSRSGHGGASGPLGMLMSMVMAAGPPSEEDPDERARLDWRKKRDLEQQQEKEKLARETPGHIQKCIGKLGALPVKAWRSPTERILILAKLNSLNKAKKIKFEGTLEEGIRGAHDNDGITVAVELHWGDWEKDAWMKSAPVLVHEATHAVWSDKYFDQFRTEWKKTHPESYKGHPKGEAHIADEMHAWENELIVYKVLRENFSDVTLEIRLQRLGSLGLEAMVREAYSGWVFMDGVK